jgi:hypothetical protein
MLVTFEQRFSNGLKILQRLNSTTYLSKYFSFCGIVVRVPGYKSRGTGFDSRRHQIFYATVGLERGPFSLVRINEEVLEIEVAVVV